MFSKKVLPLRRRKSKEVYTLSTINEGDSIKMHQSELNEFSKYITCHIDNGLKANELYLKF